MRDRTRGRNGLDENPGLRQRGREEQGAQRRDAPTSRRRAAGSMPAPRSACDRVNPSSAEPAIRSRTVAYRIAAYDR